MDSKQMILWVVMAAAVLAVMFIATGFAKKKRIRNLEKMKLQVPEDEKLRVGLSGKADLDETVRILIAGLGGADNITALEQEGMRIKAETAAYEAVDEKTLKSAHIGSFLRPSKTAVHLIIGAQAPEVRKRMLEVMDRTSE